MAIRVGVRVLVRVKIEVKIKIKIRSIRVRVRSHRTSPTPPHGHELGARVIKHFRERGCVSEVPIPPEGYGQVLGLV